MFTKTLDFFRRHRRKLALASLASGAVVLAGKFADYKLREREEEEAAAARERARRQHHFESTDRTGTNTLRALLPAVRDAARRATDPTDVLGAMAGASTGEDDRERKLRLWQELRLLSLARCACNVLGSVLLVLLLRVQMAVLGGRLYREETAAVDANRNREGGGRRPMPPHLTRRTQECFLNLCGEFAVSSEFHDSIKAKVASRCREGEEEQAGLMRRYTAYGVADMLRELLGELAEEVRPLGAVLMERKKASGLDKSESAMLRMLREDALDVLESETASVAAVVRRLCSTGAEEVAKKLGPKMEEAGRRRRRGNKGGGTTSEEEVTAPLAKLVPMLNDIHEDALEAERISDSGWLVSLLTDDDLRRLSSNVYEAFCSQDDSDDGGWNRQPANFYEEPDLVAGVVKFVCSVLE